MISKIRDKVQAAVDSLPIYIEVTTDALDQDRLPMLAIERASAADLTRTGLSVEASGTGVDLWLAHQQDVHWDDIEQVAGALIKALPSSLTVERIEQGRGASGFKLMRIRIQTGTRLDLEDLPDDFRYRY